MYKSESSLIWAKLNYLWVYCKRSSVFLIMFCNIICPSMACIKKILPIMRLAIYSAYCLF